MSLTLDQAIARIPFLESGKDITTTPLGGGITNLNYKIDCDGKSYALRITGAGGVGSVGRGRTGEDRKAGRDGATGASDGERDLCAAGEGEVIGYNNVTFGKGEAGGGAATGAIGQRFWVEACGKMVMGFDRENHAREVHKGKSVEWRKVN